MAFPPVRTFVVHRSNWYSRTGTITLTSGTLYSSEYPLTRLIDGLMGPMTRFATKSMGVKITLPSESNVNLIGVFNHNLDPGLLIQPYVDGVALSRSFSVSYPHCWIDLRAFNSLLATGLPLTTVELRVAGNSQDIALGEIVVAGAYLLNGTIESPTPFGVSGKASRRRTQNGRLIESGTGAYTRQMRLNLQLETGDDFAAVQSIFDDVSEHGEFVVVAPSSRVNDIWMVRWPHRREVTYPRSGQFVKVPLELVEEAGGLLV